MVFLKLFFEKVNFEKNEQTANREQKFLIMPFSHGLAHVFVSGKEIAI